MVEEKICKEKEYPVIIMQLMKLYDLAKNINKTQEDLVSQIEDVKKEFANIKLDDQTLMKEIESFLNFLIELKEEGIDEIFEIILFVPTIPPKENKS